MRIAPACYSVEMYITHWHGWRYCSCCYWESCWRICLSCRRHCILFVTPTICRRSNWRCVCWSLRFRSWRIFVVQSHHWRRQQWTQPRNQVKIRFSFYKWYRLPLICWYSLHQYCQLRDVAQKGLVIIAAEVGAWLVEPFESPTTQLTSEWLEFCLSKVYRNCLCR